MPASCIEQQQQCPRLEKIFLIDVRPYEMVAVFCAPFPLLIWFLAESLKVGTMGRGYPGTPGALQDSEPLLFLLLGPSLMYRSFVAFEDILQLLVACKY